MIAAAMLKSAIVLAAAACVAMLLKRQSAAVRHTVWTAGLVGALAVPLFSVTLPSWSTEIVGQATVAVQQVMNAPILSQANPNTEPAGGPASPEVPAWTIRDVAVVVWISGAAMGLLLMLLGASRLAWVAIRAEPVENSRLVALAEDVRQSLGLQRTVRLLQNRSVRFLGTWGVVSPRVLVPAEADNWSAERVRMVLAHEMAHIKRHDWSVQVLSEAARAIYWFNPIFWMACSRLRRESEQACDDTVVRLGVTGTRYAEELLDLTRALRDSGSVRSPILAMAQPSHLERRLVALLNPSLNRLAATPWAVIVVALIAVGLTLPLAAVRAPEARVESVPLANVDVVRNPAVNPPLPDALDGPKASERPEQVQQPAAPRPAAPGDSLPPPVTTADGKGAKADLGTVPCNVTPIIRQKRMDLDKTAALGSGPWHINADRTIWAWDQPYIASREVNSMWMRPEDTDLIISGRRIDGDAPPLETKVPSKYATGYVAAALVFPTAGCWEVTGTAGNSKLTFITKVEAN